MTTTHDEHGTHPDEVRVTKQAAGYMDLLTADDAALYAAALERFRGEATAAGLGCWLDRGEALQGALRRAGYKFSVDL